MTVHITSGSIRVVFKNVSTVELGRIAMVKAIKCAGIDPASIDESVIVEVHKSSACQKGT